MVNVLGPDIHIKNIGRIHFVQFAPDGVFGWILKDPPLIDSLLTGIAVVILPSSHFVSDLHHSAQAACQDLLVHK